MSEIDYGQLLREQEGALRVGQERDNVNPALIDPATQQGVPVDLATRRPELVQQPIDYGAILRDAPNTARFLSDNSVEDPEELSWLEKVGREFRKGQGMTEQSELSLKKYARLGRDPAQLFFLDPGEWTDEDEARLKELRELASEQEYEISWRNIPEWFLPETIKQIGGPLMQVAEARITGGIAGAAAGGTLGRVAGPKGMVAGTGIGAALGATMNTVASVGMLEMGLALDDYMQDPNMDPDAALGAAATVGVVNGLLETLGLERLMVLPKGLRGKGVKTLLNQPTFRKLFARLGSTLAKTAATESITEGLQEMSQLIGGVYAKAASAGEPITVEEILAELTAGADQIGSSMLVGGVVALPSTAVVTAPQTALDAAEVREANRARVAALELGNRVKASPTASQSETATEAVIDPDAMIYFQADDWERLFQGQSVDPREAAAEVLGDGGRAYDHATESGTAMPIPVRKYASKLAATEYGPELAKDVRLEPDSMSYREKETIIQQELDAAQQEVEADTEVLGKVTERLLEAGVEPTAADLQAQQFAATLASKAQRRGLGETPMDLLDRYGFGITADGIAELDVADDTQVLDQPMMTPSGVSLEQDFGDLILSEERQVEETGKTVTIERAAQRTWEQTVKRRNVAQQLLDCL